MNYVPIFLGVQRYGILWDLYYGNLEFGLFRRAGFILKYLLAYYAQMKTAHFREKYFVAHIYVDNQRSKRK